MNLREASASGVVGCTYRSFGPFSRQLEITHPQ